MNPRPTAGPSRRPVRLATAVVSCALVLGSAAACGGSDDAQPETATDSSASSSASPTPSSDASATSSESASSPSDGASNGAGATMPVGESLQPGQAVVVSASDVEEQTSELASALVDDRTVDTFVADVDPRLADEVRAAVKAAEVPDGSTLFGSVVAVGCEEPVAVTWESTFDGIQASADLPKSTVQCLVPVTSVALFLVENA